MDLKQLNYFVTIVDHKSFSKAAQILHISQPSLSNAVKSLENELGFQILDRNTRNIELTEAGTILYKKASRLLLEMDIVKKEMEDVKNIGSGEIQLGMIESVKHWIPKVILQYNDDFPNIRIKLTEVLSGDDVKNSLRNYKTHAIITNQFIQEDDIETIPLYNEKLVLVLHESNQLMNHANLTLKDLVGEPFIISSEGFQTREDVLNAFAMEDAIPTTKYEIERFETALSLVREGIGISLIPENYLQALPDNTLVKKCIDSPALDRTVYLTYLKNRYVSPAIHAFINKTKLFFS
ncbi:LysR family transcriptional regulator [Psychrobacillus sp. NPDC096389]|uniref:LysR family transcriptional regulator n=1 Tax=Psychrobacillus sp. NPDC096389 TaxID=3364490 RepID=UPI0037F84EA9